MDELDVNGLVAAALSKGNTPAPAAAQPNNKTVVLILLFITVFLFWLYNKGLLGQIVNIIKGTTATTSSQTTVMPMPVGTGTGYSVIPGSPTVPYVSGTSYLSGTSPVFTSGNTINNQALAAGMGFIPVNSATAGANAAVISGDPSAETDLMNGWQAISSLFGL